MDALVFVFNVCITMRIEVGKIQVLNQAYICSDFDLKLKEFKLKMVIQIFALLEPFLTFSNSFIQIKAYNMLTIMFDLHFKNMKVI